MLSEVNTTLVIVYRKIVFVKWKIFWGILKTLKDEKKYKNTKKYRVCANL